jgi:phosphate transport system substrate-binding protein
MRNTLMVVAGVTALLAGYGSFVGCGGGTDQDGTALTGAVSADGSSTVFPISEAMAEEFQLVNPGVRVTVGLSGTGGGFKRFTVGETDINDASRPIKESELAQAEANGIAFLELPVAYDGLSVVIHPANDWVDSLTVEELRRIWQPGSTVSTWQDVRPEWPAEELRLFGAGTDSGTFDYFTEVIMGESGAARPDFTASEDDNVLVQGVAGERNSLGFFGYAYYAENRDQLKAVPIDGGTGPVLPSEQSVNDGSYAPLSRPIFIYVTQTAAERPEVDAFVDFYLENAPSLVGEVGYVPLPAEAYAAIQARFDQRVTGTVYAGDGPPAGASIAEIFAP